MERPAGMPPPFVWPVKGTSGLAELRAAREALKAREREELNRLLYVAGFEGGNGPEPGCWYELIRAGLDGLLERSISDDGREVMRLAAPQTAAPEVPEATPAKPGDTDPLPPWSLKPAPREPQLTIPLAPSRLAPYETDDEGDPLPAPLPPKDRRLAPAPASTAAIAGQDRFLRGTLTHALLEHLPAVPRATWTKAAEAFLTERGRGLSPRVLASIAAETLAVLADATFAPVFGEASQAEVPIVAVIPRPMGSAGPPLRIVGQIDRLAVAADSVLIVDYKTNRAAPRNLAAVAPVYLYQLAAYRLAIRGIFPDRRIRAALLWTEVPYLMEIPEETLDVQTTELWRLDTASLDA
jgi:ATP-dependent helicase/nuclease subunit A